MGLAFVRVVQFGMRRVKAAIRMRARPASAGADKAAYGETDRTAGRTHNASKCRSEGEGGRRSKGHSAARREC